MGYIGSGSDTSQSWAMLGSLIAGLGVAPPRPMMLIGAPGSGKTTTVAKLAARAVIAKLPTLLISADRQRAGAGEQLDLLGRAMGVRVKTASDPDGLADIVRRESLGRAVFIDGPATNPFDREDLARLAQFIAAGVEPVLVMPAGGDAAEAAEIALAFAGLGLRRLIATRLDSSRRLGGLLAAGDAANLQFTQAGITPAVADGLRPIEAMSLARLLLRDPGSGEIASFFDHRASE
ncbi:MAG: GTPase, partial [Ferrovibrionaceae bacterium]